MRRLAALTAVTASALALAAGATASPHGFRDPRAPAEAAAILNKLPNIDNMSCHWKVKGHLIGCVGLVNGETAQLTLWTDGRHVLYRVCAAGQCSGVLRAHHVFGRPY